MAIKITQNDGTAIEFDTVEELREFEATQGGLETDGDSDEDATLNAGTTVEGTMIFSADDLFEGDEVVFSEDYTDSMGDSAVKGDVGEYVGKSFASTSAVILLDPITSVFVKPDDVSSVLRKVPTTPDSEPSFEVGDFVEIDNPNDVTGFTEGRFYKVTEIESFGGVRLFDDDGDSRYRSESSIKEVVKASELSDKITEGAHIATKGTPDMRAFTGYKLYEVTSIDCDGDFKATDEDDCSMRIYENEIVSFVPASESDDEETPTKRPKVGDKVRIVIGAEEYFHWHTVGDIGTVVSDVADSQPFFVDVDGNRQWHKEEGVELVTESEESETSLKFKVGDRVRVIDSRHGGLHEHGKIAEVHSVDEYGLPYNLSDRPDNYWYAEDELELVEPLGKDANGEDLYEGDLVTGVDGTHYGITNDKALMSVNDDGSLTVINQLVVPEYAGRSYPSIKLEHFVKTNEEEFNAPKFRVGDAVVFTKDYTDLSEDEVKEGTNGIVDSENDQRVVVRVANKFSFVEAEDAPNVLEIIRKAND